MSDLIFKTNGEEKFRIPSPALETATLGTKCPETKLEIKMTETDISKVLIEGDYATIMGVKYKRVEEPKPRMNFLFDGKCEVVSYNKKSYYRFEFPDEIYWYKRTSHETYLDLKLERVTDGETHRLLEGVWFNDVKKGKYDEPYCSDEPEYYDEVEWDKKDNPQYRITDEVVDKLIKQHQAQKLYNRLYDELGYDFEDIENIVSLVEDWLPKPQSAEGSQNVSTELLVDGFNHCLEKIKGMLR
jgi:hypothetical protein